MLSAARKLSMTKRLDDDLVRPRLDLDRVLTERATIVVDDVNRDPRYLACSLETKSEIVAPIRVKGEVVGELDIDSHTPAAFTADDRQLVEHCARLVGLYLEKTA